MINIIGITGKKFSGKDTLGDYFVNNHGYIRLAFADALKNACAEIFGFDFEQLQIIQDNTQLFLM
jgi:dephospho-CoA kinase